MRLALAAILVAGLAAAAAGAPSGAGPSTSRAVSGDAEIVKSLRPGELTLADDLEIQIVSRVRPGLVLLEPAALEVEPRGGEDGWARLWRDAGLEAIGVARSAPRLEEGDDGAWIVIERTLTLEPPLPGEHATPSLSFVLRGPDGREETLSIASIPYRVVSVLDDGGERAELEVGEARGLSAWEAPAPFPWVRTMAYALAGILVLLAGAILAMVLLTRRTTRSVLDRLPSRIDRMRRSASESDHLPGVWDEASDLFARCVSERLEPGAERLEHEEMVSRSSGWFGLSARDRNRLAELLREIDRVRYAGEEATRERTLAMLDDLEAVLGRIKAASDMVVMEMQSAAERGGEAVA